MVCDCFLETFGLTSFCLLLAFKLLVKWLAWRENRYQYLRGFVFANGVLFLELSFFGLYISELIGCDGFRYPLRLPPLHL